MSNSNELGKELPNHLKRYVVDQNYSRYTPIDQAVWRYILRQLKNHLSTHGHPIYAEGLSLTGISVDEIPRIEDIDEKLRKMGWKAISVSGFIPPAAFMEFQALGYLPIASDMRSIEHIFYTPAPDIVHEAAGHAPIIADPEYAEYLRKYAQVAKYAIISEEDMALYGAIRELSDTKENPDSTEEQIASAEKQLTDTVNGLTYTSEAGFLSRMNWWTAEYGLYGDIENPKIYGAGLLSSLGESRSCLDDKVKKLPMSIECIDYSYDITEPQPQLFVAESCVHLEKVLDQLADRMAFRQQGKIGLDKAIEAKTVNTIELSSGLQISGQLDRYIVKDETPAYLQLSGPCQLSVDHVQLGGHGVDFHSMGYGTALGLLKGQERPLEDWSESELAEFGFTLDKKIGFEFASGVKVEGNLLKIVREGQKNILMTFDDCTVTYEDQTLFQPEWGIYDLALGLKVEKVFGGPADRNHYDVSKDFDVKVIPLRQFSEKEKALHSVFAETRELRIANIDNKESQIRTIKEKLVGSYEDWLVLLELLEIADDQDSNSQLCVELRKDLTEIQSKNSQLETQIELGINLVGKTPLIQN